MKRLGAVAAPAVAIALTVAVAFAFAAGAQDARPAERTLDELVRAAGEYVVGYETTFGLVVADEDYVQRLHASAGGPVRQTRHLRSDVAFVRAPGTPMPWWLLRDVYEVDGDAVRDRQARLEKLLLAAPGDALARAQAIADEGTRFNLGLSRRNFNIPTLVLAFLHPSLQPRFSFERKGETSIEGRRFVEIAFRERGSPTVIRGPQAQPDVRASGRVFVHDGLDGTVGRTELVADVSERGVTTRITLTTEYRPSTELATWVPTEMRERLSTEGTGPRGRSGSLELVEGEARYSGFRRAQVSTDEDFRLPPDGSAVPRP